MKHPKANPFIVSAILGVVALSSAGSAADIYKANNTSDLNTVASWSTVSAAQIPNPAALGTDNWYFNDATMLGSKTVSLGGDMTIGGLALDNTTTASPGNTYNLVINSGNTLTLNSATLSGTGVSGGSGYSAAGIVLNRSVGGSVTLNCDVKLGATQTWVTSRALTVGGAINLQGFTLSNNTAGSAVITMGGIISGTGNLSKSTGTGTLAVTNTGNTFSGTVTAIGGTLSVTKLAVGGSNSSLGKGSSTISLNGANLTYTGTGGDTTDRSITMPAGAGVFNNGTGPISFSAANVVQSGTASARTLTLGGSYAGGANTLGSIIGNSGTGANITSLGKNGASIWTLTGVNTYTGSTSITQGTLRVTGSGVLGGATGSVADANNVVFGGTNANATLEFETTANLGAADQTRFRNSGGTAGTGGTLKYIGTTAQTVSKTIQCDSSIGIRLESDSVGGAVTFNGTLDAAGRAFYLGGSGTGDNTLALNLTNNTVTKNGVGRWVLTGANTYTGATIINAGTLAAGASGAFGNNSPVTLANDATANIDLNGFDIQIGSVTGGGSTGGNINLGAKTLTIGGANTSPAAYAGTISGVGGGITKTGTGTLTLAGTNSYTGATMVSAGTLAITGTLTGSTIALANTTTLTGTGTVGAVTVASGGLLVPGTAGAGALTTGDLTFSGTGTITLGTFSNYNASPAMVVGNLTANGAARSVTINIGGTTATNGSYKLLTYTGGSIAGTGTSAFVLGTKPSTGARQSQTLEDTGSALNWVVSGASPVWTGAQSTEWSINNLIGPKNWKLDTNGSPTDYIDTDVTLFDDTAINTVVDISVANVTPTSMTFNNSSLPYTIQGSYGITAGNLIKSGTAGLTISNANSFAGGTALNSGTITVGTATALGTGSVALNGGTLAINGQTLANPIVAGGGAVNGSGTLAGNVTGTTLICQGTGDTLVLTGTNTVAADITTGTTLQIGNGGTAGTIGNISNSGTAVFDRSDAVSYAGTITGAGSVQKPGAGTLTLTAAQAYTGATTLTNGTLKCTGSGSIETTSGITIAPGAAFEWGRDANVTRDISGTGTITRSTTTGNAVFSGNNSTFAGNWNITSGYVGLVNDSTIGASTVGMTLNGGGIYFTTTGQTLAATRTVTLGTTGGWLNGSTGHTCTFAAKFTGTGPLNKVSGEKAILTAVNDFTGNIANIAGGGTLEIGGAGQLGNGSYAGTVAIAASNALSINTTANQTLSGVISGGGNLAKGNTGALALTVANTYTGTTTINDGTLTLGTGASLYYTAAFFGTAGATNVFVNAGGTLETRNWSYGDGYAFNQMRNNSYALRISGGTVRFTESSSALRSFQVAAGGATLEAATGVTYVKLAGTVVSDNIIQGVTGGTITLTGAGNGEIQDGIGTNGTWSATAGIIMNGTGTWSLTGANTYTGDTIVNGGTLAVNGSSIADTNKLIINGGKVAPTGTETVNALYFGAAQQASGTWGATGSGATHINDAHFSGTGVVSVATGAVASYATWISGFSLGGQTGINQDPDGDGVPNGIEFVLKGGNPEVNGTTQLPAATYDADNIIFTFQRDDRAKDPAAGVIVTVEAGTDLASWPQSYVIGANTASSSVGVVISNDTDANPDTVTVTIPRNGAVMKYARLKVTQ